MKIEIQRIGASKVDVTTQGEFSEGGRSHVTFSVEVEFLCRTNAGQFTGVIEVTPAWFGRAPYNFQVDGAIWAYAEANLHHLIRRTVDGDKSEHVAEPKYMNAGMNELAREIHRRNLLKGFYDSDKNIGEILALIHSEVSEMLEAHRNDRRVTDPTALPWALSTNDGRHFYEEHFPEKIKDTFEDELADTIIRCLDLAGFIGIDIHGHVLAKMRYNQLRPHKHGKKH